MKSFNIGKIALAIIALFMLSIGVANAALGDIWALPGNVLRVTSQGHLVPGTTAVTDIGSTALNVRFIYGQDVVQSRSTLANIVTGTNATYTIPSRAAQVFVPSINTTRAWTLPAPTVGAIMIVSDTAGNVNVNGNITLTASSGTTINGAASVNFNSTYGSVRLVGVSSTLWQASEVSGP